MVCAGKTVRFVPSFLECFLKYLGDSFQLDITFIKNQAVLLSIKTFCNTNNRERDTEFIQHLLYAVYLAFTAINHHDVGKRPAVIFCGAR